MNKPSKTVAASRRLARLETVAETYDVAVRTVRAWVSSGLITGYKVGPRAVRVDLAEVEAMMVRRIHTAACPER